MTAEPIEVEEQIEVPRSTGIPGFLRTIETILKLPRVLGISINNRGLVTYRRVQLPEERASLGVNFDTLQPSVFIRQGQVKELLAEGEAVSQVHQALESAALERVEVTAWVMGLGGLPLFHKWCPSLAIHNDRLLGLPVYVDRALDDQTLVLAASHAPRAYLSDCHRFYKIGMLLLPPKPATVEIV
jgi:hypothetical protein